VYAVARPTSAGLELTLSLAGHHPPLVLRRSGGVEPVGELGTVLGLFESPDLHDHTVTLAHGEVICMFTDGLVEARNGNDLYDTDRTAAVLERCADQPIDAIADELICSVRDFHGNELVDDLALLLLRASP